MTKQRILQAVPRVRVVPPPLRPRKVNDIVRYHLDDSAGIFVLFNELIIYETDEIAPARNLVNSLRKELTDVLRGVSLATYLSLTNTSLEDLSKASGVSLVTLRRVLNGMKIQLYRVAKKVSDATGGHVTVAELCE